jgi:hypothetical protein
MVSGKSTHTTRLTDGDFIMSPSLTNLFEAAHGNGILLLEDGATNGGNRNTPASLPGAVSANGTNGLNIKAGYAVIDGMVVDFGNYTVGVNANTYSLTLQDSTIEGTNVALSDSGDSVLLVVYVCTNSKDDAATDAHNIQVEMGTKVTSGFPVTPETFLSDTSGLNSGLTLNSKQSTVLAVVKCVHNASGGDLNLQVDTIYDMRTFIRHSPIYFTPMTKDSIGTYTNRITSASGLDNMHGGGDENGALTKADNPLGALWMSNNKDSESVLYFSAVQKETDGSLERNTWRIAPDNLKVVDVSQTGTTGANAGPTVDTANYFIMNPTSGDIDVNPEGSFPKSHTITILNLNGSNSIGFNSDAFTIAPNKSAIFAYDGNNWRQAFVSGNVSGAASGAAGRIQVSAGSGNHTSDADFIFEKGEVTGVLINNGSGYSAATTSAMTVDGVNATTKISVGDVLRRTNNAGDVIGTVTAVTSTSITIGAGTLTSVNNDDPIYREGRLSVDGVVDISKPIFGPTGIEFTPIGKNPYKTTAANSLWRNSADSNRLYSGSTKILLDGDSVGATTILGLTDTPANFTSAANKFLQVNSTPDAIIFDTIAEGDLPTALPSVASIGQSGSSAAGILTVNKDLTVTGNLIVSGTTTTINVDTVNVEDINLTLGSGVGADADVDGGGITLASTDGAHTILYESSDDSWRFSDHVLPTTNTAKDLGTASVKWGTIHVGAVSTGTYAGTGNLSIPANASVLKVDVSNSRVGVKQATPVSTFQYESVGHGYVAGASTTGSDTAEAHTLFAKTAFGSAEALVLCNNTTDGTFETHKAVISTVPTGSGGSAAVVSVYGQVRTDATAAFCTFAAQESGGNIQLLITPGVGSKAYTFKVAWKGIAV